MRDLSNLEKLMRLKEEAKNINYIIKTENYKLSGIRDDLIESGIKDFLNELGELSKYGSAGYTDIKLDFYRTSYRDVPEIIHRSENGKFVLLANPSGYGHQVVLYDSELGWDWYSEKTKLFIAMNKDRILDIIEKRISKSIVDYIENSNELKKNIQLKRDVEELTNCLKKR